jgi:Zn-dependent protease with chaperone function
MAGLLPLIFALVIAETAATAMPLAANRWLAHVWWWPVVLVGSCVLWLALCETAARLAATKRSWRLLATLDVGLQAISLTWFAWLCYGWGWAHQFHAYTLALLPWLALQLIQWWCMAHAVRAATSHTWSRFGRVMHQLRFGILPMLLILPFFDFGPWLSDQLGITSWFMGDAGFVIAALTTQLFLLGLMVVLPLPLMWLWGAKPLTDGALVGHMRSLGERMGVRVAGLMRWPVPGGKVYNAAVIGMIPRLRFVLFTDDLVRDLPQEQVTAVLGHELGHARHGHLWTYFAFATMTVLATGLVQQSLADAIRPWFVAPPIGIEPFSPRDSWGAVATGVAVLILMAVQWRVFFGVVSRACERQADLAGAELVGSPEVMAAALKTVAHLAGQPEDAPSWRHHSIAQRVAFLRRVHADPALVLRHHRHVAAMRSFILALCCAFAAALAVQFWTSPEVLGRADSNQAGQILATWTASDRDLAEGLAAADAGDPRHLAAWINRADSLDRQRLAHILMQVGIADTREAYRQRHRLRPFLDLDTGNPSLDHELENSLAYIVVAGADAPTAQDLAIAGSLLPRLEARASQEAQHELLDTVGCIRFAQQDWSGAVAYFARAVELSTAERAAPAELRSLYQRRLDAARANLAGANPAKPLPKDWPESPTVPAPAITAPVSGAVQTL